MSNLPQNPFKASANRRFDADLEFRVFEEKAPAKIAEATEKLPRYPSLERVFGFRVFLPYERGLQAEFGLRSMGRKDPQGKLAIERGATLLYTLGGAGDVAVAIYPFVSNLARPFEDHIYLRIGRFTAHQLLRKVSADVADLIAYAHVTSLDSDATYREQLRIWLLRKSKPMQLKGEFKKPAASA